MIQLETYKGTQSRHTCPKCGKRREFTRFIDTETGEYLPDFVGICNRSSNCGYRYTAKEFFRDNPTTKNKTFFEPSLLPPASRRPVRAQKQAGRSFDVIPPEHFIATLDNNEENAFVQFLLNLFPDNPQDVQKF
ncbi:MAG: PG0870-related protein [Acidobacteria bacterium]|nr:PG0870-related protein [Acidobacteriota bacterium]MCA1638781.1 PG0870-related protein [Acidobacteriota bacterium]